ncbi:hypothetical protein KIPB_008500 [Kipferlia bialata]|uniref:Uncharacterized protein n=1 Tax=Kipferlia bialata TaxID=797122 RepID=A0A9K3D1S1_9EUKA|nr:hypothetical protein KIPB_008500 [Kipferlia bialata]|eukprot:g8500.t1
MRDNLSPLRPPPAFPPRAEEATLLFLDTEATTLHVDESNCVDLVARGSRVMGWARQMEKEGNSTAALYLYQRCVYLLLPVRDSGLVGTQGQGVEAKLTESVGVGVNRAMQLRSSLLQQARPTYPHLVAQFNDLVACASLLEDSGYMDEARGVYMHTLKVLTDGLRSLRGGRGTTDVKALFECVAERVEFIHILHEALSDRGVVGRETNAQHLHSLYMLCMSRPPKELLGYLQKVIPTLPDNPTLSRLVMRCVVGHCCSDHLIDRHRPDRQSASSHAGTWGEVSLFILAYLLQLGADDNPSPSDTVHPLPCTTTEGETGCMGSAPVRCQQFLRAFVCEYPTVQSLSPLSPCLNIALSGSDPRAVEAAATVCVCLLTAEAVKGMYGDVGQWLNAASQAVVLEYLEYRHATSETVHQLEGDAAEQEERTPLVLDPLPLEEEVPTLDHLPPAQSTQCVGGGSMHGSASTAADGVQRQRQSPTYYSGSVLPRLPPSLLPGERERVTVQRSQGRSDSERHPVNRMGARDIPTSTDSLADRLAYVPPAHPTPIEIPSSPVYGQGVHRVGPSPKRGSDPLSSSVSGGVTSAATYGAEEGSALDRLARIEREERQRGRYHRDQGRDTSVHTHVPVPTSPLGVDLSPYASPSSLSSPVHSTVSPVYSDTALGHSLPAHMQPARPKGWT